MILIAALFFAWPKPIVEVGPPRAVSASEEARIANACCGSMLPLLKGGERLYVERYHGQPLIGRIISNGKVLHMVTAETADAVLTSGTNSRRSDGWTPKARVEYVVVYIEKP